MMYQRLLKTLVVMFIVLLFDVGSAFGQWGRSAEHMPLAPWGSLGWFGMIFHLFIPILFVVALVLLVKWLWQNTRSKEHEEAGGGPSGRTMEILKERYARGEIDREEFEQKKRDMA